MFAVCLTFTGQKLIFCRIKKSLQCYFNVVLSTTVMLLFSSGLKLSNGGIYANFVAQSKLASSGFCRFFLTTRASHGG